MPLTAQHETSQLVIVDVQEALSSVMEADPLASTVKNCSILMQAAKLLEISIICTEQYPKGLGATLPELAQYTDAALRIEKTCFSCVDSSPFRSRLRGDRPQIVLAGMEAHICVLQTALQLQESGKQVFVVEDAVISRNPANKHNALLRLRQAGVIVSNTESVVFEWLKVAEGDAFKQISKLIR
ncbi:MAG TPA: hydrolase [Methylophilaceae bacterium]